MTCCGRHKVIGRHKIGRVKEAPQLEFTARRYKSRQKLVRLLRHAISVVAVSPSCDMMIICIPSSRAGTPWMIFRLGGLYF
jgi:hypothetical protein